MVALRAGPDVSATLTAAANLLVTNEIIPALQRAIGGELVLPDSVQLVLGSHADGHVPGRFDPATGEVRSVEAPIVCATEKRDLLRYVLVHELAHYHELSVRKARSIRVPGVGPTQLWSEYFAQRVAWESGLVSAQTLMAGGGEGVSETVATGNDRSGAYSWAYMMTFVLAHADSDSNWLDAYPGREDFLRATVGVVHNSAATDGLFRRFPDWRKADIDLAVTVFRGLLKVSRTLRRK